MKYRDPAKITTSRLAKSHKNRTYLVIADNSRFQYQFGRVATRWLWFQNAITLATSLNTGQLRVWKVIISVWNSYSCRNRRLYHSIQIHCSMCLAGMFDQAIWRICHTLLRRRSLIHSRCHSMSAHSHNSHWHRSMRYCRTGGQRRIRTHRERAA